MTVLTINDVGIVDYITIDNVDLDLPPDQLQITQPPVQKLIETADGAGVLYSLFVTGHPRQRDRLSASIPWASIANNATIRSKLERIRGRGGVHSLSFWSFQCVAWDCSAGQTTFYLPRKRRDAGAVLKSGANASKFPPVAYLEEVQLTVTRKTLAQLEAGTPGAGNLWIADEYDSTGFVPLKMPAANEGDLLELYYCPVFNVALEDASSQFQFAEHESRDFRFLEI